MTVRCDDICLETAAIGASFDEERKVGFERSADHRMNAFILK